MLTLRGLTLARARVMIQDPRISLTNPPPTPILVMFDVDGTLTESFDLDSAAYLDAVCEVCGIHDVSTDWATYRNVTDAGILQEIFEARLGRTPSSEETAAVRARFAALIAMRIEACGGMRPVGGAAELLARLSGSPDEFAVAYASGGWRVTAELKLRAAGLPVEGIPAAFSDDDFTRDGICRAAQQRAEEKHGRELTTVIYVGDGVWDVRTSRQLGYGFIGIGDDAGAAKLRAEGAVEVLRDFRNRTAFFAAFGRTEATLRPDSPRSEGIAESVR